MKNTNLLILIIVIIGLIFNVVGAFIMSGREGYIFSKFYEPSQEYKDIQIGLKSLNKIDYHKNSKKYGYLHHDEVGFKDIVKIISVYTNIKKADKITGICFSPSLTRGDFFQLGIIQLIIEGDQYMIPIASLDVFKDWVDRFYQRKAIRIGGNILILGFFLHMISVIVEFIKKKKKKI